MKTKLRFSLPDLVRLLAAGWLFAVAVEFCLLPRSLWSQEALAGTAAVNPLRMLLTGAAAALALWRFPRLQRWSLPVTFGAACLFGLIGSFSWGFLGICLLVEGILVVFALRGWNSDPVPRPSPRKAKGVWVWITAAGALGFFLLMSIWNLGRYFSFSTPTYDFGIFTQMFHSMVSSGAPLTTLERDGLLSHFAVHVSPSWYLLLPFYLLWPRPETLPVLQAGVMASAVIPLWLLGKERGFPGSIRALLCLLLLLQPAFGGGAGYDIHENCLLTTLLLWLFWASEQKNTALALLFALLTLGVKEDAAVYVAVFGLYLLLDGRPKTGGLLFSLSVLWFLGVTWWLQRKGQGVMTYRYDNLIYDGSGSLMAVVTGTLRNPIKVLYECANPEKSGYLLLTLLPLLGLPLLTRRYQRYVLLIPWVLVNLMPDYQYQHDIFFQYSFGSQAFLIYLTVLNLRDLGPHWKRLLTGLLAVAVSMGCFFATVAPTALSYGRHSVRYWGYYESIRQLLDEIPEGASVTASTFCTAYLSNRETLYDLGYASRAHLLESEYIVISLTDSSTKKYGTPEALISLLEKEGYARWKSLEGTLIILRKKC